MEMLVRLGSRAAKQLSNVAGVDPHGCPVRQHGTASLVGVRSPAKAARTPLIVRAASNGEPVDERRRHCRHPDQLGDPERLVVGAVVEGRAEPPEKFVTSVRELTYDRKQRARGLPAPRRR
jgi:hypothetical protein